MLIYLFDTKLIINCEFVPETNASTMLTTFKVWNVYNITLIEKHQIISQVSGFCIMTISDGTSTILA
jgi:hypothetical protein